MELLSCPVIQKKIVFCNLPGAFSPLGNHFPLGIPALFILFGKNKMKWNEK
jgi:hypothetical protein